MKSRSANHCLIAATIRLRAGNKGRRSAWICGRHQGAGSGGTATSQAGLAKHWRAANTRAHSSPQSTADGTVVAKIIASAVRKGNVIEHDDGKLYVVLKAESFHPGKGTPT